MHIKRHRLSQKIPVIDAAEPEHPAALCVDAVPARVLPEAVVYNEVYIVCISGINPTIFQIENAILHHEFLCNMTQNYIFFCAIGK